MVKKILVIEDEYALRQDILELLNFEGYSAVGAENGLVGLHLAYEYLPDLIICDITMPGLNGYGVLERIRSNPLTVTMPFIFLTAHVDRVDQRLGMDKGADDYLTKPFALEELLASVEARLAKAEVQAAITNRELDNLRDNIILSLPHELRTPLTVILGFSDILSLDSQRMDSNTIAEMALHIKKAAFRLHNLVENYVSYAQIQVNASNPQHVEKLRTYVTTSPKVHIEHQAMLEATEFGRCDDLMLRVEAAPALQVMEDYVLKIVSELVDNAFKFSSSQTMVCVEGFISEGVYHLRVTNQGRGMSPKQIADVGAYMQFDRQDFEQQGSGLGLIIAKRLAEMHNGTLTIESTPGKEITVEVTLPLASMP